MRQGKVKWYNGKKCFGFITPDAPNENGNTDGDEENEERGGIAGIIDQIKNVFGKIIDRFRR